MPTYPREEVQATVDRWLAANKRAWVDHNWRALAEFYTDDAVYIYDTGPFGTVEARGIDQIRDICLGADMGGWENWTYPYETVVIDNDQVMARWWSRGPGKRADGSYYQAMGMSWFRYGGNGKWREQVDLFDLSKLLVLADEMGDAIKPDLRQKLDLAKQLITEMFKGGSVGLNVDEAFGRNG